MHGSLCLQWPTPVIAFVDAETFLGTLRQLFWACVLLAMIVYVFGIIFTQAAADYLVFPFLALHSFATFCIHMYDMSLELSATHVAMFIWQCIQQQHARSSSLPYTYATHSGQ